MNKRYDGPPAVAPASPSAMPGPYSAMRGPSSAMPGPSSATPSTFSDSHTVHSSLSEEDVADDPGVPQSTDAPGVHQSPDAPGVHQSPDAPGVPQSRHQYTHNIVDHPDRLSPGPNHAAVGIGHLISNEGVESVM